MHKPEQEIKRHYVLGKNQKGSERFLKEKLGSFYLLLKIPGQLKQYLQSKDLNII